MLLESLAEFGRKNSLASDYELKRVPHVVVIDLDGKFVGIENPEIKILVPRDNGRTANKAPQFFWDNNEYLFEDPDKLKLYLDLVDRVVSETKDDGAAALAKFLRTKNRPAEISKILKGLKEQGTRANFTFRLSSDKGLIFERPKLRKHWQVKLHPATGEADAKICRVTGQPSPIARLHPPIKNVPGTQGSARLIAFNQSTACFEGRKQGDNFEVSQETADLYGAALNYLLERTEVRRHRAAVRLGQDRVAVLYTLDDLDLTPLLSVLDTPIQKGVSTKLTTAQAWEQLPALSKIEDALHVFILKGNMTRIMMYDFFKIPVSQLVRNLFSLRDELGDTFNFYDALEWLSDCGQETPWGVSIFQAVAQGDAYPVALLDSNDERWHSAVLSHNNLDGETRKGTTMPLNKEYAAPAYLFGRLVACVNSMEWCFFRRRQLVRQLDMIAKNPGRMQKRVMERGSSCFGQVEQRRNGKAWIDWTAVKEYEGLVNQFDPTADLPPNFTPEQQWKFMQGFFQQKRVFDDLFKARKEKKDAERDKKAAGEDEEVSPEEASGEEAAG